MMLVSIIIPVIRPNKAARCIEAIEKNSGVDRGTYEIVTEEDTERIGAPMMVKKLTNLSNGQMVCFLGDDTIPQRGFLKNAIKAMDTLPDGWGLVGFDDNIRLRGQHKAAAHWLGHKKLLPLLDGEFFNTGYKHCWCDNELTVRASELGRYVFCEEAYVYHDHPIVDLKSDDRDYRRVYSQDWLMHDVTLFRKRRRNNWQEGE
jgi:GT2 family glycosyltransferase